MQFGPTTKEAVMHAGALRDWNPRDDNMADMAEVEVLPVLRQEASLRILGNRELLILHDAVTEELQMRGVAGA